MNLQADHDPIIQDFINWIRSIEAGIQGPGSDNNCKFVPAPQIEKYFQDREKVKKLLRSVFREGDLPVNPTTVANRCPIVFSILLRIGKGHFIWHFVRHESLWDRRLPFTSKPESFPTATNDDSFFSAFQDRQWDFCAHTFQPDDTNLRLGKETVLPIVERKKLGGGATAVVFKIVIHEAYNQLHGTTSESQHTGSSSRNTFVLKTYCTRDAEKYYENEVAAFIKLNAGARNESNLIGFYGSFVQNETYNVLLQYADVGTLENYFQNIKEPRGGKDIINFWRNLFGVITALIKIHEVEPSDMNGPGIFQGWHQDVKPANVLIVSGNKDSPYDYQFKLADLGLSHFSRTMELQKNLAGEDSRGTRTYGAPECYRHDDIIRDWPRHVKQNVDIFSLGCVYSEAATWVVHGKGGLQEYRQRRKDETDSIPGFRDGDCFHNGHDVLGAVRNWHQGLPSLKRVLDHVTPQIWDQMLRDMLGTPKIRPSAMQLWEKSKLVLWQAEGALWEPENKVLPLRPHLLRASTVSTSSSQATRPRTPPEQPPKKRKAPFRAAISHYLKTPAYNAATETDGTADKDYDNLHAKHSSSLLNNNHTDDSSRHHHQLSDSSAGEAGKSSSLAVQEGRTVGGRDAEWQQGGGTNDHDHGTFTRNAAQMESTLSTAPTRAPPPGNHRSGHEGKRGPPPVLSVDTLRKWKEECKKRGSSGLLTNKELLNELEKRDHVFIVDDAGSMREHWISVQQLFGDLAYLVKDCDPNGLELYFTISRREKKSSQTKVLLDIIKSRGSDLEGSSNLASRLATILHKYQRKLEKESSPIFRLLKPTAPRPVNIYILTDGIWQGECDVATPIKRMVGQLEQLGLPDDQVGIQFIQFGNDQAGTERLEYLDFRLVEDQKLTRDIVDVEPSGGNVWKMLLGSINKWFDEDTQTLS